MAEIGVISARITADDSDFRRAFRRSRGSIRELRDRFNAAAATAAKFSAAIGAVAVAVGTKLVNAQMKAVQFTNRLVSISGVQARTIGALRIQAEKYGVSQERANDAVIDFSERLGEAREGTGEAIDGFKMLEKASGRNIDLGQNVNAVWRDFVDAMAQVSDESTRAAIAAQTGGDALRDMLPVLAQGEEGFRDAAKAADELGLSFDRIEAQQVQNASAAISRVQQAFSGLVRQATIAIAPVITQLSNKLVDAARDAGGFRDAIVNAMENGAVALAHIQNAVKGFQIAWEGMKLAFQGVRILINKGLEKILEGIRDLANKGVGYVNNIITAFNKIPGITIEAAKEMRSGNLESAFRNQADEARDAIDSIQQKMHELAMSGRNPAEIRKRFQELRQQARQAAEEAASERNVGGDGGGGELGGGAAQTKEEKKRMEERLARIREHLMTEQEIRNERHQIRMEQLKKFRENELLTKKEYDKMERQLEAKHQEDMLKQRQRGMKASTALIDTQFGHQTGTMLQEFRTQIGAISQHNKKAFQIQKAFAISDAIVNAYQGITRTLAAYPYPFNLGMAAAHAAVAFAKVNAIRSQSFGGGGAGSTALPGSSAAQQPAQQGPGSDSQGGGGPTREATFNIQGDNFGPGAIEQIADGLNEFMGDNGDLKVNVRRAT